MFEHEQRRNAAAPDSVLCIYGVKKQLGRRRSRVAPVEGDPEDRCCLRDGRNASEKFQSNAVRFGVDREIFLREEQLLADRAMLAVVWGRFPVMIRVPVMTHVLVMI